MAALISDQELAKVLTEGQFIEPTQLQSAVKLAAEKKEPLADILLQKDLLSDENLATIISDFLKLPLVSLKKVAIPDAVLAIIPEAVARQHQTIAFEYSPTALKVGTAQPLNTAFLKNLSRKVQAPVHVHYASEHDVEEVLPLYNKGLQASFDELLATQIAQATESTASEPPVAKIVDLLVEYASENKASDIHIEPNEEYSLVRFRIDGVLHDVLQLPIQFHEQVVSRIKVLARLRIDEHLSAQDGKLQMKQEHGDIDIRISIIPIVEGEKVVMRLLSSHSQQFGLADLGMSEVDQEKVEQAISKPYGMVIATGPTGSGKTTTMYAILKLLNTREKNIATIEDPVEYEISGINQVQVNPRTNLTFADGLKSLLRQDPDIIYVGEIRDEETASIAINSATTGHLVVSTLHTNDAATTFPRLIDMQVEPFLIASTINCIVGQRLVRKICDKCKVSYTVTTAELQKQLPEELINQHLGKTSELRLYKGKGCAICRETGYVGRIGLYEILPVSDSIQDLINKKADSSEIMRKAREEGMTTMLEDGFSKVQVGITTIDEVLRATKL